jgi:hypothetical protein
MAGRGNSPVLDADIILRAYFMKRIYYHNKMRPFSLPERWEELSSEQYIKAVALLHSNANSDEKILRALQLLLNKSDFTFKLMKKDIIVRLLDDAVWIFSTPAPTKQLLPKYKNYYGPESDFDNLTLVEFHHCEMAYYQFVKEKDDDQLTTLVANIYRHKKFNYDDKKNMDGDVRERFNVYTVMFNESEIKHWPQYVKLAVLMWYDACRQHLEKMYPLAFGNKKMAQHGFMGLFDMIRNLSGTRYGTFAEVEQMFVHNAFAEIIAAKREEMELEKTV